MRAPPTAQQPYDNVLPDRQARFLARASGFKEVHITVRPDGDMDIVFDNTWSALAMLRALAADPYQVLANRMGVTRAHVKYAVFGAHHDTGDCPSDIGQASRDLVIHYFWTGDMP